MTNPSRGIIRPAILALAVPVLAMACSESHELPGATTSPTFTTIAPSPTTTATPTTTAPLADFGTCGDADTANAVVHHVDQLNIPMMVDATGGNVVGFDLDGQDAGCGVPDFQGGVDNAFLLFSQALGALPGDVDLQREIDAGLCIEGSAPPAIDLSVAVSLGTGCALITMNIGGAEVASFVASSVAGELYGTVQALPLTIPYRNPTTGMVAQIRLQLSDVRFSATIGASGLSNVLIGGALPATALQETMMDVLPIINGGPCPGTDGCVEFDVINEVLANLYDVPNPTSGLCGDQGSLSVGLFANAGVNPITTPCPARP